MDKTKSQNCENADGESRQVKQIVRRRHWWKWICEFCYRQSNRKILPNGWDLVWQSAVCPECQERVKKDGGYNVVVGGAYANKPDPRAA